MFLNVGDCIIEKLNSGRKIQHIIRRTTAHYALSDTLKFKRYHESNRIYCYNSMRKESVFVLS